MYRAPNSPLQCRDGTRCWPVVGPGPAFRVVECCPSHRAAAYFSRLLSRYERLGRADLRARLAVLGQVAQERDAMRMELRLAAMLSESDGGDDGDRARHMPTLQRDLVVSEGRWIDEWAACWQVHWDSVCERRATAGGERRAEALAGAVLAAREAVEVARLIADEVNEAAVGC